MIVKTFKSLKQAQEYLFKIVKSGRKAAIKRVNGVWNVWVLAFGQK